MKLAFLLLIIKSLAKNFKLNKESLNNVLIKYLAKMQSYLYYKFAI